MQHPFTRTTFFVWSGLLIWAAQFLFVYSFAAVACAQRFAGARWFGVGVVPFVTTIVTAVALGAAAWCLRRALQRARALPAGQEPDRLIHFLSIALSALALIAISWSALPALMLHTECHSLQ